MKQDVMPSIVKMDTETLRNLTTEVKETLATDMNMTAPEKTFYTGQSLENTQR